MNCTLCRYSHMAEQFGQTGYVCKKAPPSVVVIPKASLAGSTQVQLLTAFPMVNDKMVCEGFEAPEIQQ
jgi:hypothetical protein